MTDVTEIDEFGAEKVSGVGQPANGTPWLLLKATEVENDGQHGAVGEDESTAMMEEMTKVTEALALLHDYAVKGICDESDLAAMQAVADSVSPATLAKAKLNAKRRNALPDSDFAYIDPKGGRHLPIQDADHVHAAFGRVSETHFADPGDEAKAKAKIDAKAKSLGMHVEKSPGVPAESVAKPKEGSPRNRRASRSKLGPPMTAGLETLVADPTFFEGGASTYKIPTEAKTPKSRKPSTRRAKREDATKSWSIEVVKDGEGANWLASDNVPEPTPAETETPGNAEWEAFDASTLDSIARGLTGVIRGINAIREREVIEAVSGDPSDWFDAMQLDVASNELSDALSLVAALAYHEAAAGEEAKSKGSGLAKVLAAVTSHLPIGDEQKIAAKSGPTASEEEEIMTTVTKEELTELFEATAKKSVAKALKAQSAKDAKVRKAEAKKARKIAKKNANNGGDITEEEMKDQVHGHTDASNVNSVGGKVKAEYRAKKSASAKKLAKMTSTLAELNSAVAKMSAMPRSGGPVLDGQARGTFMATEGRSSNGVTKSNQAVNIERLAKELATTTDAARKEQLSIELTYEQLRQGHLQNLI
jgi:hypothetical protein